MSQRPVRGLRMSNLSSCPASQDNYLFVKVFQVWWRRCDELYVIDADKLFALSMLCKDLECIPSAIDHFRKWLIREESGRGGLRRDVNAVYMEYHASRLMRLFLRKVLSIKPTPVIAGGFPAAMWAEKMSYISWRPRDVDIFLFDVEEMKIVQGLYESMVTRPLRRTMYVQIWKGYDPSLAAERSLDEVGVCRRRVSNVDSPEALRRRIKRWLRFHVERTDEYPELKWLDRTIHHLQHRCVSQQYKVVSTKCLKFIDNPWCATLPINLIHIAPQSAVIVNEGNRFVCENFDITLCCVALDEVKEDLTMGTFLGFHGAFEALRKCDLCLTDRAFSCQVVNVSYQMSRLCKYMRRGYSFPK